VAALSAGVGMGISLAADGHESGTAAGNSTGWIICLLPVPAVAEPSPAGAVHSSNKYATRNPGGLIANILLACRFRLRRGNGRVRQCIVLWIPIPYWWFAVLVAWTGSAAGFLMVSTWRFWSARKSTFRAGRPFQLIALLAIGCRVDSVF